MSARVELDTRIDAAPSPCRSPPPPQTHNLQTLKKLGRPFVVGCDPHAKVVTAATNAVAKAAAAEAAAKAVVEAAAQAAPKAAAKAVANKALVSLLLAAGVAWAALLSALALALLLAVGLAFARAYQGGAFLFCDGLFGLCNDNGASARARRQARQKRRHRSLFLFSPAPRPKTLKPQNNSWLRRPVLRRIPQHDAGAATQLR